MQRNRDVLLPHEEAALAGQDARRPDAVARQHARGKRTARERIAALVDEGSLLEIGALARPERPGEEVLHADAIGELGNEKQRRCWEIAAARGIPVVMLFDGGGHRIQEGLDARSFAGGFDIQEMQTRLSGWVPMVAAMLGPGFGQPTLTASLCDYVVAVRGIAMLGMAPPALVRAATGEDVDAEASYSADAQARHGTVDRIVDSEDEALDALRCYLALLPSNAEADLPDDGPCDPDPGAAARLDDVIPANLRQGYDVHDVLAGLVDEDSTVVLKEAHAPNILTALARVAGRPLGIIANQPLSKAGVLDAGGAAKAAHLVSLTVLMRKGYGGGYVIMSGERTFHPELVAAWPHAETAVMAVETAVDMVFRRELADAADPRARRRDLVDGYRQQIGALRGAEGFGFDVVIRPSQTRTWLERTICQLPRRGAMQTLTPRHHPVAPL